MSKEFEEHLRIIVPMTGGFKGAKAGVRGDLFAIVEDRGFGTVTETFAQLFRGKETKFQKHILENEEFDIKNDEDWKKAKDTVVNLLAPLNYHPATASSLKLCL